MHFTAIKPYLCPLPGKEVAIAFNCLFFGEVGHANAALVLLFFGQKLRPEGMGWEMENATKAAIKATLGFAFLRQSWMLCYGGMSSKLNFQSSPEGIESSAKHEQFLIAMAV